MHQMKRTLERLDREIEELEASGEYADLPAPDPYAPKLAAARTASKIFEDIERAFKQQPTGCRLQWQPARPGSLSAGNIGRYYDAKRRSNPNVRYDMERIEKAETLDYDRPPWHGPEDFDGYVIYPFPRVGKALMECPEVGNATYVIHKDWESWSQLDKQQLIAEAEQGGDVTRIIHQGDDWFEKIVRELGIE